MLLGSHTSIFIGEYVRLRCTTQRDKLKINMKDGESILLLLFYSSSGKFLRGMNEIVKDSQNSPYGEQHDSNLKCIYHFDSS